MKVRVTHSEKEQAMDDLIIIPRAELAALWRLALERDALMSVFRALGKELVPLVSEQRIVGWICRDIGAVQPLDRPDLPGPYRSLRVAAYAAFQEYLRDAGRQT